MKFRVKIWKLNIELLDESLIKFYILFLKMIKFDLVNLIFCSFYLLESEVLKSFIY